MKYLVAVDVPSLHELVSDVYQEPMLLYICNSIPCLKDTEVALHSDVLSGLQNKMQNRYDVLRKFCSLRMNIFDDSVQKANLTSRPDMLKGLAGNEYQYENALLGLMHQAESGRTVFFVNSKRWTVPQIDIETIRDKKTHIHPIIIISTGEFLSNIIKQNTPELVQLKHGDREYLIDGNRVAPFRSYFAGSRAGDLLKMAYWESAETDNQKFPKRLYTWDSQFRTYIEFRRSGGDDNASQYHGFELDKKSWRIVPEAIRLKYHQGL